MSLLNRVLDALVGLLGSRREDFWDEELDEELWVDECNGRSLLNRVLDALVGLLGSRREDFWDEELWVDDPLVSWSPAGRQCVGSERRTRMNPAATDCTTLNRRRATCRLRSRVWAPVPPGAHTRGRARVYLRGRAWA